MENTLSITITFCNQDEYIAETVCKTAESFKTSKYSWEMLVGLDNPSDLSVSIIRRLQQKYLNLSYYILHSDPSLIPLSRASQNRLYLLGHATGEFALILDGDDYYVSNADDMITSLQAHPTLLF